MYTARRRIHSAIATWLILALMVTACGPFVAPASPPAVPDEPDASPVEPAEPAALAPAPRPDVERHQMAIFDIDGGRVTDPELWNPFVPGSRRDQGFHQALIEPLFLHNLLTGEIEPWLAISMTPNETLDVWTLILREGVKWSDGEDFNADDVVFTIQMLLDHAPELAYSAAVQQWVASVEKIDDLTVVFRLNQPNPRFQQDYFAVKIWGSIPIVPEHIWRDQDPLTFKNYDPEQDWPVFTGPYTLQSASAVDFAYVRDDNWWGAQADWRDLPAPEVLIWNWAGPEETRTALMADGQLDSLMDITLGAFQALQARNPSVIAWFDEMPYAHIEPTCTRTLEFNTTVEPWNDKEMRWAINYAIDRDQIVEIAYEGTTVRSRHFFPISEPLERLVDLLEEQGLYERYPIPLHDPDRTRQILEAKGYTLNNEGYYEKEGEVLSMDIQVHEAFIEKQRIVQVLVEQFHNVGINANSSILAGGTWGDNFAFGNFDVRAGWQTCGSVSEPWSSLDTFNARWVVPAGERASFNAWRWENEEYSALIDEMGILPLDDPRIDELFVQAMEIWMEELPVIPITQARKLTPFDTTYWTGWPTSEDRYTSPTTWWQNTHLIIHNLQPTNQ